MNKAAEALKMKNILKKLNLVIFSCNTFDQLEVAKNYKELVLKRLNFSNLDSLYNIVIKFQKYKIEYNLNNNISINIPINIQIW